MLPESTTVEYKSLKKVEGKTADFSSLASTCVCLANAQGGIIIIGVEDKDKMPPPDQVISQNILHERHPRNPHLIRIIHDLGLMEGEGSGYDLIYELDSKDSKPFPEVNSSFDKTEVVQSSEILDETVVYLLEYISENFVLTQRELIALGIIAREKKVLGTQLSKLLQLTDEDRLRSYVGKLIERSILITSGRRKGTYYLINPELIKASKVGSKPTLKTIELHTLKALVVEDLKLHPKSLIGEIQGRIPDVIERELQKAVYALVEERVLEHDGGRKYRRYWLA